MALVTMAEGEKGEFTLAFLQKDRCTERMRQEYCYCLTRLVFMTRLVSKNFCRTCPDLTMLEF